MKKLLFAIPLLLINLSIVKAEDNVAHLNDFYDNYSLLPNIFTNYQTEINNLINYYNTNYSQYPNYVIYYYNSPYTNNYDYIVLFPTTSNYFDITTSYDIAFDTFDTGGLALSYYYNISTHEYAVSNSNFPLHFDMPLITKNDFTLNSTQYDKVIIPPYDNTDLNVSYPSFELFNGSVLPTFDTLSNGNYNSLIEVDLSNYDYIVLSLKDYIQQPFNTTIYTQGSLCFTPVYDYGMKEKNQVILGSQNQACTDNYTSFTPVSIYVIQSDLDNHAVYYIKKQPNISTILKIPTSVFDITYITSDNTDPQVSINGRSYPVIPFNDLTDTANKSTDEGYISGQVCSLGDINCQSTQNGMDISDLFTHPLTLLQTLWDSITSVFILITTFIGLLPITLQAFLYTAFMLAIILGILKIIL